MFDWLTGAGGLGKLASKSLEDQLISLWVIDLASGTLGMG